MSFDQNIKSVGNLYEKVRDIKYWYMVGEHGEVKKNKCGESITIQHD